ncbi:hypothetical protein [Phytoactinopolyspora mesophila]|uniref:Teneurin NHL domain-containing protein n=1 Tax=Phytoactinopolyspora mesophila TaxID=2650750 RepID=A0A7K3LXP4_9ACTN|nr:hypothetical protein [Phytoactinopolyspora mesophila]NDL55801.1 hypothetical protein [Phytoactinopolyspora mesophila]
MLRISLLPLSFCAVLSTGVAAAGASAVPVSASPMGGAVVEPGPLETVVGTGELGHSGDGGPAVDANLGEVRDLAFDDAGNLYIATRVDGAERGAYIREVAPDGTISTVAGGLVAESDDSGRQRMTPDGLAGVTSLAAGPDGELYIADSLVGQVMRVDPGEEPTIVAGTGDYGHAGDGGPAAQAQLRSPAGVAVGQDGELYIADAGGYIRRIDTDGVITTIAGTGDAAEESSGDGGPAAEASFTRPFDVVVDSAGNLYVADVFRMRASDDDIPSQRIRRIDTEGVITTIAGGEACGYTGDGGPAEDAELCFPRELTVGPDGTVYLVDPRHHRIRMITPDGTIHSLPTYFKDPSALAIGPDGALYVGDGDQGQVHRIPLDGGGAESEVPDTVVDAPDLWAEVNAHEITVVAGTGEAGYSGDDGPAGDAQLSGPDDLAVGPDGTLYVLDSGNGLVRAIHPDGTITTVAGGGPDWADSLRPGPMTGDGRLATEVGLRGVTGIDVAADGTLFLADRQNKRVRQVSPGGVITTVAGTGAPPDESNAAAAGGVATHVAFNAPHDVAAAADGSLYVTDSQAHQILHVDLDGTVRVIAGTGDAGFSGDGGPAVEAELERPTRIDVGHDGTLYVSDSNDSRIRAVDADGVITTVGGKEAPEYEDPTEGVPATEVYLRVYDLAADDDGTIYLSRWGSIQAIGTDGIITVLTPGDTGAAALAVDGAGSVYFSQARNHQVSVLPKAGEDATALVAAEADTSGTPWWTMIIGVAAVGVAVGGYLLFRRRRSSS